MENFGQISTKNALFYKKYLFKITLCDITWATVKPESWNLASVCRKKVHKIIKKRNFKFSSFFNLIEFFLIFQRRTNKNGVKNKKYIRPCIPLVIRPSIMALVYRTTRFALASLNTSNSSPYIILTIKGVGG